MIAPPRARLEEAARAVLAAAARGACRPTSEELAVLAAMCAVHGLDALACELLTAAWRGRAPSRE